MTNRNRAHEFVADERPNRSPPLLGPGAEFDLIVELARRWGNRAVDLGDDAAIVPLSPGMNLVVSVDSSVEHVHFEREWLTPEEIGYRATAAALSDLAAMAASPIGVLCAMTIPESWRSDVAALAEGIGRAAAANGARVLGGDLSRAAELSLCVTVLGTVGEPLRRRGAAPGDRVYVTGRLGAPRAAVAAWRAGREPNAAHRERFARPSPRLREARWLAARGATAGIDISDGLVSDLQHLAAASRVVIDVELQRVPRVDGVPPREAAASGEEYEMLVTAPSALAVDAFEQEFGLELTEIGEVGAGAVLVHDEPARPPPGAVYVRDGGKLVDPPLGYDHFSR